MRLLVVLCAVLALSGCSAFGPVVDRGAKAYGELRVGAEVTLCRVLSVGEVIRAYPAGTPAGDGWWGMCKTYYTSATPPWKPAQE